MKKIAALVLALCWLSPALAQQYPLNGSPTQSVGSAVTDSVNTQGQAVPDSAASPHPVTCISGCASPIAPTIAPTATPAQSVTTSSARVALGDDSGNYENIILTNYGGNPVCYNLGGSSVTAATSNTCIPPGLGIQVPQVNTSNSYVAFIGNGGTSSLGILQTSGPMQIAGGSGGSGGSAPWVNTNKVVPWDGTTNVTVKPASTAAAQTDTAQVTRSPDIGTISDAAGCAATNTVSGCLKQLHADLTGPLVNNSGDAWIGATDWIVAPSSSFTRPANTTAYVAGYQVANSTTAGSVVPLSWTVARANGGNFYIRRVKMSLSSKSVTNTKFTIHFYTATPTIAAGDGAAWSTTLANWICSMTVTVNFVGTDVSTGIGLPDEGNECNGVAGGSTETIYGLVVADAAYTPASGETITVVPEVHQN
jgi:hypothetical protein